MLGSSSLEDLKATRMWHSGTKAGGDLGSAGQMVGLGSPFQPKEFPGSINFQKGI